MIYSCEKLEKHRKKAKIDSNFWVGWLLLGYTRCRFEKCCLVCLLMGGMFFFFFLMTGVHVSGDPSSFWY